MPNQDCAICITAACLFHYLQYAPPFYGYVNRVKVKLFVKPKNVIVFNYTPNIGFINLFRHFPLLCAKFICEICTYLDIEIKRKHSVHQHICGICGKHYRHKLTKMKSVWICPTYNTLGKAACASKQIPESILMAITAEVLGTDALTVAVVHAKIANIRMENGNRLVFHFKNGGSVEHTWNDRSRSESWTDEMRKAAGENRRKSLCQER